MPAMPLLEKLARLNRTAVFFGVLAVFLGALLLPGPWGGLVLLALAAVLGAILLTTWPVQANSTRALRVAVLLLLVITGITRPCARPLDRTHALLTIILIFSQSVVMRKSSRLERRSCCSPSYRLAACGNDGKPAGTDGKIDVVAGFYPLQFAAAQVGGDRVSVTNLVQPGAEPHDLELKPSADRADRLRRPGGLPARACSPSSTRPSRRTEDKGSTSPRSARW
jgi:hypothetical protein